MKTISKLTAGAAILLALAGPSFAASPHHAAAHGDAVGSYASVHSHWAVDSAGHPYQYGAGVNLPYPDRPYGDPDSW
jgi:hypothetical protein